MPLAEPLRFRVAALLLDVASVISLILRMYGSSVNPKPVILM